MTTRTCSRSRRIFARHTFLNTRMPIGDFSRLIISECIAYHDPTDTTKNVPIAQFAAINGSLRSVLSYLMFLVGSDVMNIVI